MAPHWASRTRALVLVLLVACVIVTCVFRANVEAQAGAYATGVLVLMLSAATAVTLALWHERPRRLARCAYFAIVSGVFLFTLADNVVERTDGIIIAAAFVAAILTIGAASRFFRATEMRVLEAVFEDAESARVWSSIVGKKVSIVPLATASPDARRRKAAEIRAHYTVPGRLAFLNVQLVDNRSDFLAKIRVRARQEESGDVTIEARGAVAIANSIAYLSELADPVSIFLGLTRENLMKQALRYIIWGEGETGLMVYTILIRYWEWTPEDDVRPLIFMMSE